LSYYVRLMFKEDIPGVSQIDRAVFPTSWPPINYTQELQNRMAHYLVVCTKEGIVRQTAQETQARGFSGFLAKIKQMLGFRQTLNTATPNANVLGFAGLWMMANEAHVINIAVQEQCRRRGLGELLLISLIDKAIELKASLVTLEVRASNIVAQNLYTKYGFQQVGVRRAYYTDNREDAIIMSTGAIMEAPFQEHFQRLKKSHSRKWEIAEYRITG
jgi:[ribosomal protein S18]-alanine N-acetyltransferase